MPFDASNFVEIEKPATDVGAERLRILADFLPSVQIETFDLRNWGCGTTACACGHAASIPELRAAGLHMVPYADTTFMQIHFGGYEDWRAICRFFCLGHTQARKLFSVGRYESGATPAMVATRIREYLAVRAARNALPTV